jgi:hypothetical protein
MKKLITLCCLLCIPFLAARGQEQPAPAVKQGISRDNLAIRPNSRDYNIVRQGNNHQRIIQMRTQAMFRHKGALMNRKAAMERSRLVIQQQMMRQQKIHQRMIQNRTRTR